MTTAKLLLVGIGYWGRNWAKTLEQLGALGGICDLSLVPGQPVYESVKKQFPGVELYNRLEPALAEHRISGVVIATPVPTHYQVARHCLLANKHVLVEKPLTLNPKDAMQLVSLAEERNRVLAVGHVLMHHAGLLKLKSLVDSGELGDILSVACTRVNLGKIRNEENVWWSLAPHDISIISLLLGEPLRVDAVHAESLLGRDRLEDTVIASMSTPSGKRASVHVSWLAPYKKHETVVIGTKAMAVFDDAQPQERKLRVVPYDMVQVKDWVDSVDRGEVTSVDYAVPDQPLTAEAKAFIAAIETGRPLLNDGANGVLVVDVLDTVQRQLNVHGQQLADEDAVIGKTMTVTNTPRLQPTSVPFS
ncbi:MAG: Gfo/Idh/MocA family oxidoreductase [Cyanobacteria bacterium HKST-UBA04]|nr:Gfo/Idh/MocA family oxidoreductase [Cyanobacteria bacterium HKST-UBA04]MCA9841688.1 Gfo/Idh/MocA family oxidoreductase [Cyanobacteria bacterium HKST-UBA03]